MPMYPYRVDQDSRAAFADVDHALSAAGLQVVGEEILTALEGWVNHGLGAHAEFDLEEWLYELLCGHAARAAVIASRSEIYCLGLVLRLMALEFPAECFGTAAHVREWRGLVEDDPTLAL